MSEPKLIFLGAIDLEPGAAITLNIPQDADAEAVRNAIEAANAERAAKQAQELEALEKLFLDKVAIDKSGEK